MFLVPDAQFTAGEVNVPGAWGAGMSSKVMASQGVLVEPILVSLHMLDNYFAAPKYTFSVIQASYKLTVVTILAHIIIILEYVA